MAQPPDAQTTRADDDAGMHTTALHIKRVGLVTVRPSLVDDNGHTLSAFVGAETSPAAVARLSRSGEIAVTVARGYRDAIGEALVELLESDARVAGIARLTVTRHDGATALAPRAALAAG